MTSRSSDRSHVYITAFAWAIVAGLVFYFLVQRLGDLWWRFDGAYLGGFACTILSVPSAALVIWVMHNQVQTEHWARVAGGKDPVLEPTGIWSSTRAWAHMASTVIWLIAAAVGFWRLSECDWDYETLNAVVVTLFAGLLAALPTILLARRAGGGSRLPIVASLGWAVAATLLYFIWTLDVFEFDELTVVLTALVGGLGGNVAIYLIWNDILDNQRYGEDLGRPDRVERDEASVSPVPQAPGG